MFVVIVALLTTLVSAKALNTLTPQASCSVPGRGGTTLNLEELAKRDGDFVLQSSLYPNYRFAINICHGIAKPSGPCGEDTSICEEERLTQKGINDYGEIKSTKLSWVNEMVVMNLTGSQKCPTHDKMFTSKLLFKCQSDAKTAALRILQEDYYKCYLEVEVATDFICNKSPLPPKYSCINDRCMVSLDGTHTKEECEAKCQPATTYKCEHNQCVVASGGVSKDECEKNCESLYVCRQHACVESTHGVKKSACDLVCKPDSTDRKSVV